MGSAAPFWKKRLKQEILAAKKIVVLAVGNKSKGDDAAGIVCAEKLKKLVRGKARSRLKILLGSETPESLTGEIRKFRPDLVLILDAAQGTHQPGTVFIVEKDQIRDEGVSTHKISLALLVSYLEETVGCKVIVLGIQPLNLCEGAMMSVRIEKSEKKLTEYLASLFFPEGLFQ